MSPRWPAVDVGEPAAVDAAHAEVLKRGLRVVCTSADPPGPLPVPWFGEDPQEVAHLLATGEWVREVEVRLDRVVAAAAAALAYEVARGRQLADDAVDGSFCDPDAVADLAQADGRIARDARQHLGVIRQERPRWTLALGHKR
jgi:hypothetical protein